MIPSDYHKEKESTVEIVSLSRQIQKLEKALHSQEQYIKYLYTCIEGHESEIEKLRQKNSEL